MGGRAPHAASPQDGADRHLPSEVPGPVSPPAHRSPRARLACAHEGSRLSLSNVCGAAVIHLHAGEA